MKSPDFKNAAEFLANSVTNAVAPAVRIPGSVELYCVWLWLLNTSGISVAGATELREGTMLKLIDNLIDECRVDGQSKVRLKSFPTAVNLSKEFSEDEERTMAEELLRESEAEAQDRLYFEERLDRNGTRVS